MLCLCEKVLSTLDSGRPQWLSGMSGPQICLANILLIEASTNQCPVMIIVKFCSKYLVKSISLWKWKIKYRKPQIHPNMKVWHLQLCFRGTGHSFLAYQWSDDYLVQNHILKNPSSILKFQKIKLLYQEWPVNVSAAYWKLRLLSSVCSRETEMGFSFRNWVVNKKTNFNVCVFKYLIQNWTHALWRD